MATRTVRHPPGAGMDAAYWVIALAHAGSGAAHAVLPPGEDVDWPAVLDLAVHHRVAPLVWQALSHGYRDAIPPEIAARFGDRVMQGQVATMMCEHALGDVLGLLSDRHIDVLVLKGAALAHALYPRPDLRPYHDLDILCHRDDYPRLYQALLTYGSPDEAPPLLPSLPSPLESNTAHGFVDPSGEIEIEAHFDVLQLGLVERHHDDLWREARTLSAGDLTVRVLSPLHQLVHLVSHAHRHAYSRLLWLIDVDLLVRRHAQDLDWERALWWAREEGIGAMFRYGLDMTAALLDTPRPPLARPTMEERALLACYSRLWPYSSIRRLRRVERHRLVRFRPDWGDPRDVVYGLALFGRRGDKLRVLWAYANRGRRRLTARA